MQFQEIFASVPTSFFFKYEKLVIKLHEKNLEFLEFFFYKGNKFLELHETCADRLKNVFLPYVKILPAHAHPWAKG
jgi:hypothetical protein